MTRPEPSFHERNLPFYWLALLGLIGTVILGIGIPNYRVWANRKQGQAELARAESNRQIKTLEAKALEESAKHMAQAEIIRAHGVAEANKIIGDSLQDGDNYLRYLWIIGLEHKDKEIIYVPTEANLPILEAGKRK